MKNTNALIGPKRVLIFALIIVLFASATTTQKPLAKQRAGLLATAISAKMKINDEDIYVSLWVAVSSPENAHGEAQAALHRAYPDALEVDSDAFTTTGIFWDIFSDNNPNNDYVPVQYNGSAAPSNLSGDRNTWLESMSTWNNVSASNFRFVDGGNTNRCPSLVDECDGSQHTDGYNDFTWIDIADSSILGIAWHSRNVDEFDIALDNNNFTWFVGSASAIPNGSFDMKTVTIHEFGHGLGLGHSNSNGSVMEAYYDGVRRSLHSDDILGITTLYPQTDAAETPTPTATASQTTEPTATTAPTATSIPPTPTNVPATETLSISSISYRLYAGRNRDKHLTSILTLVDETGKPIQDVLVSIRLFNVTTSDNWAATNTTSSSGRVSYALKNAPAGCYAVVVENIQLSGYTWDGASPTDSICK